ncbi:MAG: SDR family oxidoreductase [Candidatus Paceibacterota bacterium]|jgi:3-oxoacyl-[acyl-carrier protein] reductase
MKLKDKVVVITGGTKGFGKALAETFIFEGAKVIVCSNDKDTLENVSKELLVDKFLADVTSFEDIEKLAQYVFKKYGTIDIWINNAGIQIAPSLVEKVGSQKLRHLFDVNFFGYFYGCQVALLYMKKRGEGLIININSTAGLEGKPEISAYSSSKFAIKGLTESIRKEIKDSEIKIYEVFPGGMQTEIYKEKYPANLKEYMLVKPVAEKVIENLKAEKPEIDLIIKRPVQ